MILQSISRATVLAFLAWSQDSRVVDRAPQGYEVVQDSVRFSADGALVAYVVKKGDLCFPVTGHTLGKGAWKVDPPVIDASGKHVAFRTVALKRGGDSSCSVVCDGKELETAEWIGPIGLSPLDGTPAFWTALGHATRADGSLDFSPVVLVFGKKKSAKWQSAGPLQAPSFSPDGQRVFSVGTKDAGFGIVSFDRKGAETKQIGGHVVEVCASPAGNEVACTLLDLSGGVPRDDEWHRFYIQRRSLSEKSPASVSLGKSYDGAGGFVWGPDGGHFAFKVISKDRLGVAVDGAEDAQCAFDFVDELTLAPGTSEVAFVAAVGCELDVGHGWQVLAATATAKGDRWSVVRGTTASAEYTRTKTPTWSPDGARLAFAAREDGQWRVVLGDSSSEPADEIARIEWAADGSRVWYGARRGDELWWCSMPVE